MSPFPDTLSIDTLATDTLATDTLQVDRPTGGGPAPSRVAAPATGHLHSIDVVRLVTVLGVVAAHSTSLTSSSGSDAAGGVLVVLHVSREVFLLLSAFVLAYSFRLRPLRTRELCGGGIRSWRSPTSCGAPSTCWPGATSAPGHLLSTYLVDLLDGGAEFHLYFLLLTFQLYLIFPTLLSVLARRPGCHVPLLAAGLAFQLGFTAAVHYDWRPPVLSVWLGHPGSWLPSYALYVIAGLVAALHFEQITDWVRAHTRAVTAGFVAAVALAPPVTSWTSACSATHRSRRARSSSRSSSSRPSGPSWPSTPSGCGSPIG